MIEQKREHFRINYPVGQHASFIVGKVAYPVSDVSQKGVKFGIQERSVEDDWDVGLCVNGTIKFLFGESVRVGGQVLRTTETHVILYLDDDIPLKYMYDEHRYIIKNFNREDDE